METEGYYDDLLEAYVRGHGVQPLPDARTAGRAADLSVHRFKRKSGPPRVSKVLGILKGLQPAELLDIGPGRGAFLWPLLATFPWLEVDAVDVLEHRVAAIEALRRGGVERVQGHLGTVLHLPFDDGAFDVVTTLEVLEHLETPAAAAREVVRVARRFVVASVPSRPDDNPEHIQLFTPDTLTGLFFDAGAARVQLDYVHNHMIAVVGV
jgi:ubiquinone/menaquinone biosynthesis C-methylase UbiE